MRRSIVALTFVVGCSTFGSRDDEAEPAPTPAVSNADAASDAAPDVGIDAGADAASAIFSVPCGGNIACTKATEICCNYACESPSTCGSSTVFQCNDAEDAPLPADLGWSAA